MVLETLLAGKAVKAIGRFIAEFLPIIVICVALFAAVHALYSFGYRVGSNEAALEHAQEQAKLDKAHREALKVQIANTERLNAAYEEYRARTAAFLEHERVETETLRNALSRAQLVTRPEPTRENPAPCPRLSDAWRVCWNAHLSGNSADREACKAFGGGVSGPGRR